LGDVLDIQIGVVFRWKKNAPRKAGRPKPAYFVFLGCYKIEEEDINEWYVILARTSARVKFYTEGNRKNHLYILINKDGNHPCFEKPSVIGCRDFYVNITAEEFLFFFKNGFIEKKCSVSEKELEYVKDLLSNSDDVPEFIHEIKIVEFIDFLIDIEYE